MTRTAFVLAAVALLVLLLLARRMARRTARRAATRAVRRFHARVNRFKLTRKPYIRATLLGDIEIATAVTQHAAQERVTEADAWRRVELYIDEIVPHFNILAYYKFGYGVSRAVLNLLYKVSLDYEELSALERLPDDSTVIYLINHRSNADYVLLAYVLAGDVSISYAVGEWARAFPLEYVFKSFGSYFIRRRYREPLYHTVLERYVQLITRNGVTQGIFPEGGLTRDGRLRPAKIGLLDYALQVARDPAMAERMILIPVALNYDRVLEDRTLLRELAREEQGLRTPRRQQAAEVARYVGWNLLRLLSGRWQRYGRAAVTVGAPMSVADWLAEQRDGRVDLFNLPRPERLARVQTLCDRVMCRIGELVPVTAVALACAAIQSFESDFISRAALLARMGEMRDVLTALNARVLTADRDIAETFDRAWRMLRMRRMLVLEGSGFAVLPGQRPLVSYYANSIAHLLGPFEAGVRERDSLPAVRASGSFQLIP
ncbi:MAG: 1-acyl-sn-glycerol-3-phosphate acyltransferase [Gemmatimonadota bacterium]|nr:1-acyl-sn-glycerol-3-phosphate acyltransferase [Gemmatimonadota bacterium]